MWDQPLTFQAFTSLRNKFFLFDGNQEKDHIEKRQSPHVPSNLHYVNNNCSLAKSQSFDYLPSQKKNVKDLKLNIMSSEKRIYLKPLQFSASAKVTKTIAGSKNQIKEKQKINKEQDLSKEKNRFIGGGKESLNGFQEKEKFIYQCGRINFLKNKHSITPSTRESEKESEFISKQMSQPHSKINKNISPWNKNIVLQQFRTLKKIGQGAFGEVHLVQHIETGMIFALKIIVKEILKKSKDGQNLQREIRIQNMLSDSLLLKLYGVFADSKNIYLIMQPMLDGSLWENKKKFRTFKEKHVSAIVLYLCEAVKALHEKDILHRDIKLQNILLMEGVAKLADFGCAVKSTFMRKSQIGSRNYVSPEQYHSRFYDKKVDIWSIGVVTYQLLFGNAPFQAQILNSLKKNGELPSFQLKFPSSPKVSNLAKDFITKLLERNPIKRPKIQKALSHQFLKKNFVPKQFGVL